MTVEFQEGELDRLVNNPSESLNVEIKTWISPTEPDGIAKIVRATFALRNRNGGLLLIGFNNETLQPDDRPASIDDIARAYHVDILQGLISRYASEPFEIAVSFASRSGTSFPIIKVATGARTPVIVKSDQKAADGKSLLAVDDLYFRSLNSNGTPSTSKIKMRDWPDALEVWFDNREADIGRFLRRQLAGGDFERLAGLARELAGVGVSTTTQRSIEHQTLTFLDEGYARFERTLRDHPPPDSEDLLPWMERLIMQVALTVEPKPPKGLPKREFLQTALAANPQLTGWPIWLDSRGFGDQYSHPKVVDGTWQAMILSLATAWSKHLDFEIIDPSGRFYLLRAMQDDMTDKAKPGEFLDPILMTLRVAETFIVGRAMVHALDWAKEGGILGYGFRWTGLANRKLEPWAHPFAWVQGRGQSAVNEATSYVEVPVDVPPRAMAPYIESALDGLFTNFDGYTLPNGTVDFWLTKLIERNL